MPAEGRKKRSLFFSFTQCSLIFFFISHRSGTSWDKEMYIPRPLFHIWTSLQVPEPNKSGRCLHTPRVQLENKWDCCFSDASSSRMKDRRWVISSLLLKDTQRTREESTLASWRKDAFGRLWQNKRAVFTIEVRTLLFICHQVKMWPCDPFHSLRRIPFQSKAWLQALMEDINSAKQKGMCVGLMLHH